MRLEVILLGFSGGVGRNFLRLLQEKEDYLAGRYNLEVAVSTAINSTRVYQKPEGLTIDRLLADFPPREFESELNALEAVAGSRARVLIDAGPTDLKTGEPGLYFIKTALRKGIHVITLDKGPLVLAYQELKRLARANNVHIKVSGAAGAALPTADIGLYSLAGAGIEKIEGIFNGTVNYILSRMEAEEGMTYREALEEAREKGIAEADPRLDVEGLDTGAKTVILANILMDADLRVHHIPIEGITAVSPRDIKDAAGEDRVLKLLGRIRRQGEKIEAAVSLEKIPRSHFLARVSGANKAVLFTSDTMGELLVMGGKSSPEAAAASALKDLINLAAVLN